ncbi:MAG: nucleotidyl transferase AbiEii/AbiGii toxin family protein [Candidatus Omnitrophica bacterium]|nr:nucleotidyl transferase AbiEii/AbiGii toxin family protein [Candidatus Omnitrophota bacterium]
MDEIIGIRNKTLKHLANKLAGFYLVGGTALSLYYFQHRESYDLDFFTKNFSRVKIEEIISLLSKDIGLKAALEGEGNKQGFAKILVYSLIINENSALKIDFVEDVYKLLKPLRLIDGISVLTIEDIYFRKILTACGSITTLDSIGRSVFIGGRQEAKDFFDLYFLSKTFMPLSSFVNEYCQQAQKESIIIWFRTYKRLEMKIGLTEIITDKNVSFPEIEHHFKDEVGKIIAGEI